MGDERSAKLSDESGNDSKEQKETLLQRRERVLGISALRYVHSTPNTATKSGEKRRSRVLQAQRVHRQRTLDYIAELENEVFRLRDSQAALAHRVEDRENRLLPQEEIESQDGSERALTLHVLIQCLNGQIAPGLFLASNFATGVENEKLTSSVGGKWLFEPRMLLGYDAPVLLDFQYLPSQLLLQPPPDTLDPLTKMLFMNFSENIAPTLVAFDGPSNGYRTLLLPLAYEDELVRWALLASSANQLRFTHPALATLATTSQAAAIDRLSSFSASSKFNDPTILAAIILLMVDGMINGGTDLRILLDMAKSWTNATDTSGPLKQCARSSLHEFLLEQVKMMDLYAKPLLHEQAMIRSQTTIHQKSSNFFSSSNMHQIFYSLESAIKQACAIYSYHILNDSPPDGINDLLETLKNTALQIPNHTPGENALAWVYFIAAAESLSFAKRTFFAKRLMGIYERGSFDDVTTAFTVLHQIWNYQVIGGSWTKVLMQMPLVIR